jgi:hypothetical protein
LTCWCVSISAVSAFIHTCTDVFICSDARMPKTYRFVRVCHSVICMIMLMCALAHMRVRTFIYLHVSYCMHSLHISFSYMHKYMFEHTRASVSLYSCTHLRACGCAHLYMFLSALTRLCAYVQAYMTVCASMYSSINTCLRMCIRDECLCTRVRVYMYL